MNFKFTKRSLLTLSRLAGGLLQQLPQRGDSIFMVAVKLVAAIDTVDKTYGGKSNTLRDMYDLYDLEERTNAPFVRLFFDTALHLRYTISRIMIDEMNELIRADDGEGGVLFFQESRWGGRPDVSPTFFSTKKFGFAKAIDQLWEAYPTGLYLEMVEGRHGERICTFTDLPDSMPLGLSEVGAARIQQLTRRHTMVQKEGRHRSYLFIGEPGTGKTHAAVCLGRAHGGRLLNIDSTSLTQLGGKELGFLLEVLAPNFLVLDDFDEVPADGTKARVRALFAHLKLAHAGCSIIVTVNDPSRMDYALLRCGRIDEPIDFDLADAVERHDLIEKLLKHYAVSYYDGAPSSIFAAWAPSPKGLDIRMLVHATDKFNHADIADLCERLVHESVQSALSSVSRLRELAAAAQKHNQLPQSSNGLVLKAATPS